MREGEKMFKFNTIEDALEGLRLGEMIIVTDNENRENEGDLICPAEFATTEHVNFMATYAKGLICMPMGKTMVSKLGLPQMVSENTDNHETAFTVSIDHVDTTTGISAVERSYTALKCVEDDVKPEEFRRPGHMFPLLSKENGVLERNGHTEATVDLMKLAGLKECGLCCEIMSENGEMMRTPELIEFAKKHQLKFITIEDLQKYRKEHEVLIEESVKTQLPTKYGEFIAYGFKNIITGEEHMALVMGDVSNKKDILCRVHSECLTGDALGSVRCDCGEQYHQAMKMIQKEGRGVLLYMRQEGRGIGLINKLKAYHLQDCGLDTVEANLALGFEEDQRDYCSAAQILNYLKVDEIRLLTNNPDKIQQLESYGMKIEKRIPIQVKSSGYDRLYLKTKQEKMGHLINY